ncbi:NADPH-dependent FMN reductase [Ornithinimicrobium sediminis]|uniref:NADPH-dependent FMN reductase n=1 Tax=Ornithinimicrobium sediminis TaxID=2904603 RepID=UPI001E449A7A|nr:NAD(P)H-dependent oxidoreductase [Ornithinimicrobium sediminis]MCE0487054.1 NAD(P)H-dependent oxidoreductase [Ornithinimicrobium sediminis]
MNPPLRIAVVIASSRPERVGPAVAEWVYAGTQQRAGVTYDLVDLAEEDLPNLDEPEPASSGNYTQEHTRAWSEKVTGYDGFVFVTPEYNRGIPGQLKNALDFLYAEWNDKAAGIVCYGSSGGLRAAEQLKLVLGELQVATVRAQVSVSIYDDMADFSRMTPRDFQARNLQTMLDQTERWAGALRTLR